MTQANAESGLKPQPQGARAQEDADYYSPERSLRRRWNIPLYRLAIRKDPTGC
jgi:hypothetical protein